MVSPNLIKLQKSNRIPWSRGGYFFDWFMYAIRIVTTILSIISTMESISKSLISQALLSKISCKQDFYVIREFGLSVEGLTAYHSHVVPCLILAKVSFYNNIFIVKYSRVKIVKVSANSENPLTFRLTGFVVFIVI